MPVFACEALERRRLLSFGPLSGEIHVSGTVIGTTPDVASDAVGNFVVAWEASSDLDPRDVSARLYDHDGNPRGHPFPVNTVTAGAQSQPRVAMDPQGNFVVVWVDEATREVRARRFGTSGAALGDEFRVSDPVLEFGPSRPAVAMNAAGGFVVTWAAFTDVHYRHYDPAGVALGPGARVSAPAVGDQTHHTFPDVATDAAGNFLIAWEARYTVPSGGGTTSGSDILARRFDAQGVPRGPVFRAHRAPSGTARAERDVAVAMDHAGNFIIAWSGVLARQFDATGAPVGREFFVSAQWGGHGPAIDMSPSGEMVAAWARNDDDVFVQRLRADGAADGFPLRANITEASTQRYGRVAVEDDGDFVVVWYSPVQNHTSNHGIFARRYGGDTDPAPGPAPDLTPGSDSGPSSSDDITNDDTPTFTGAAPPDSVVRLFDDEVEIATTTAGSDGQYGITAPPLESRHRRFRVSVQPDGAAAGVLSAPLYAVIDTVAPTVVNPRFVYATAPHRVLLPFGEDVEGGVTADEVIVRDLTRGVDVAHAFALDGGELATLTFPAFGGDVLPDADYRVTLAPGASDLAGNPFAQPVALDFYFLMGDAQPSRRVDVFDFNLLAYAFGTTSGATFFTGDFNYDGRVNLADFDVLARQFGRSLGPPPALAALPSPWFDEDDEDAEDVEDVEDAEDAEDGSPDRSR